MDMILVPGLWLDARSWDPVIPALNDAGFRPLPLTMPGTGRPADGVADIGIQDWVNAVVAAIDAADEPVVLVGHSGGGNVVWGAADRRPERVARVIFVDTVPPAPDRGISEFPVVDGLIPFPGWDFFPEEDVYDLTPEHRAATADLVGSIPPRVPTEPLALTDERRYRVPVTLLMGSLDEKELEGMLTEWGPYAAEYTAIADRTVVKLDTAHWPQFSAPERLTDALVSAVRS
ncbi:alpha/beta fold hydrolase [Microbacterium sp. ZW T5_56]|uniref:alpha/beta fold hydrolase n=1 Tax=Microbacterium sp. ZW T5_56 TaxID=3378081 RepID=UPI003852B849